MFAALHPNTGSACSRSGALRILVGARSGDDLAVAGMSIAHDGAPAVLVSLGCICAKLSLTSTPPKVVIRIPWTPSRDRNRISWGEPSVYRRSIR
jgi:hypothetical protein